MVKIYLLIGKDNLFLYEKKDQQYTRQYIDGSASFPYDMRRIKDTARNLLEALENEYNLSGFSEMDFVIVENYDPLHSQIVSDALEAQSEGCVVEMKPLEVVLKSAIQRLSREKKEKINELGVNFDGVHYRLEGGSLSAGPFSLLGYPLSEDKLMNLAG